MVIVAGYLMVDPDQRDAYLLGCRDVVELARNASGCLDFAIGADLLDPARINIHERWATQDAVDAFRGSGPSEDQGAQIRSAAMAEYDISVSRSLS